MTAFRKVRQLLVGKPFAPLDPHTRHAIAVTPLLAWVGLGADGLSSSCYGPEEAFLALAHHTPLALFLALATAATVFIIALGYNRGIALFPTGGGYRVATSLFVTSACASRSTATTRTRAQLAKEDELFSGKPPEVDEAAAPGKPDPSQPTAVPLVGKHRGASMRVLLWVNRLFPGHFRNVIVLAVGEVDVKAYDGHEHLEQLRRAITEALGYDVAHRRRSGIAANYRIAFGTNPVVEFMNLASSTLDEHPNAVCFASKLIFRRVNFLPAWLHNQTPVELQARLHVDGKQMVLLPMNVGRRDGQPRCTPAWTRRGKRRRRLPLGGRQGR
uniref:hypothetical protein n=1 Tax=Burkholderia cepacia TaxID=292 RepID=UPI0021ABB457|nr:hypothetical protein [Burkholderia cepacia]